MAVYVEETRNVWVELFETLIAVLNWFDRLTKSWFWILFIAPWLEHRR